MKVCALRADVGALDPRGKKPCARTKSKERQRWRDIAAPFQPAAPPPEDNEQSTRKHRSDRLGQQRGDEDGDGRGVIPQMAIGVEPQISQCREEKEHSRERVLQLADPRHRLDLYWMEREKRNREFRARHLEAPQDDKQKER